MIEFDVPFVTPSLNTLLYKHWRHRAKQRRMWELVVIAGLNGAQLWKRPKYQRAEVVIERFTARPIKDRDNLYGGVKPLMDALVAIGLLQDDSSDLIELTVKQTAAKKVEQRTRVTIRPLDPPAPSAP